MEGGGGSNAAHICWLQQKPHRVSLVGKKTINTNLKQEDKNKIFRSFNKQNIYQMRVYVLLRVYVIKSVCLKTHHLGVDTVADNPGNPPCCGCLYHLRLEIAFVVPVLTIPLGHYILQSHPQLIFENKKHTLQKMLRKTHDHFTTSQEKTNKYDHAKTFFSSGGRGCRSVCSYGHRSWPRGFVAVKEWKESGPDLKASWIK